MVQVNSLTRRRLIFPHLNKLRLEEGMEKVWEKGMGEKGCDRLVLSDRGWK